ncbi:MAG TPA: Fic family protein [Candidatus Diapherotrites archaeon]|uniref:Fic family protein n=1 Tax=Candidatus Iainarchaeum sp. TaxID=3101447 RepID=A0A7J4J3C1_9ARCH|nr:Fic family protein [Candidatus Diapherotrites archaeon]
MYLKEKTVKGKKYFYLAESFRLPNGKVSSIEKGIPEKSPLQELEKKHVNFFIEKKKEAFAKYAIKNYKADSVFSKSEFEKSESIKVDYQRTIRSFTKSQLKDVFDRFIANFTYESNAIEGNSLTLKDVAIVMFEKRSIEGKDLREIYETRNSRPVMDLLLRKKFDVSEKSVIKMHEMLMKDMDERTGYKQIPNYIPGSNVEFTPPEKVEEEMGKLIEWYNKSIETMHPIQVSALFHGKFIKIHPFEDGNGRVGRFISNAILTNHDYPPFIIRKTQREAYIKCMQDFFRGYTQNLERLFLRKYKDTYRKFFEVYLKYIKK